MTNEQEAVIARIREVYPADRTPCAWCNSRKSHHYDCPVVDIHALLALVPPVPSVAPAGETPEAETSGWRRWAWVDRDGCLAIMKPNATRADVAELGEPDERLIRVQISEVTQSSTPETPEPICVCQVDDGLVQEWVSKARAVAISKGFQPLPRPLPAAPVSSDARTTQDAPLTSPPAIEQLLKEAVKAAEDIWFHLPFDAKAALVDTGGLDPIYRVQQEVRALLSSSATKEAEAFKAGWMGRNEFNESLSYNDGLNERTLAAALTAYRQQQEGTK